MRSSTRRAHTAFIANATFAGRNRVRRGNYLPNNSPSSTSPRTCVAAAFIAIICAGRGQAEGRPTLRDDIGLASLLQQPLLVAVDTPGDHPRQQLQEHQIHHPTDTIPGALCVDPRAHSSPDDHVTLGRGGGVIFHVCTNIWIMRIALSRNKCTYRQFIRYRFHGVPRAPGRSRRSSRPADPAGIAARSDTTGCPRGRAASARRARTAA